MSNPAEISKAKLENLRSMANRLSAGEVLGLCDAVQRLTEELRTARDELRWYEEVLKLAKANIAFGEAERDALQKRNEKAEAALKQYAKLDNWIKRRGVDVWIGPNEGPDLAKSALGNAGGGGKDDSRA